MRKETLEGLPSLSVAGIDREWRLWSEKSISRPPLLYG